MALPGLRFRKTISILPGVRINLSKSGVSTSVGGKGATLNVGRGKPKMTVGVPGTGLSYRAPATGTFLVLLAGAVIVVGIAWLIRPDLVGQALHWWQPKWF
jgi:hypothetical protein